MKNKYFVLILIFYWSCNSIKLSPVITEIVEEITTVESLSISFWMGGYSEQKDFFLLSQLDTFATTEELVYLTKHQHKTVKLLASIALIDRNYDNLPKVFKSLLSKNERIWTGRGMHGEEDQLAGVFYRYVQLKTQEEPPLLFYKNIKHQLDSTLLAAHFLLKTNDTKAVYNDSYIPLDENRIDIFRSVLFNIEPLEKYYSAIKTLCKKGYKPAFIALAKFQKEEDIPLILKSNNLLAIEKFPHPAFWEYLKTQKKQEFYWEHTVASYQNQAASDLLLANIDDINPKTMCEVISKYYTPFYDTIGIQLWEKYQVIDWTVVQALVQKDAQKATSPFIKGLKGEGSYKFSDYTEQFEFFSMAVDSTLELMLTTIATHQKQVLPKICPIIISKEHYPLSFIKKYQIKNTTEAIWKDLKKYNNHDGELKLAEIDVLFSFQEKQLTEKVFRFLKKDFPNWHDKYLLEEEVIKTLKKYNLPFNEFF